MNVSILVVEYEPRYVEHVRTALAASGYRLEIVSTMDEAVNQCATFEPTLVIMTSVLPNLKIEDAITQLRARAGLRATPFLILMSGYGGDNPKEDAVRYGAQDILERPFGADALSERVEELILNAPSSAATQAIPQEMLEALRRSAGLDNGQAPVTSDDLFGDILSDIEGGEQQPVKKPADVPPPTPIPDPSRVDAALADIVESGKQPPKARATRISETDVDKLLEETLSGLDITPSAVRAQPAPPKEPAVSGSPSPTKGPSQAVAPPPPAGEASAPAEGSPEPPPPDREPPSRDPAPTAKGPAPSTGDTFGQYMIEEHIATGGMADVYKARMIGMEGFQKTVAIKRIISSLTDSDEFVRMFIDEAKLAAQLSHNNIIQIFDLGKVDRSHYIAMEFIEGRDLRSILEECNERDVIMPISLALYITTLLASALDYAHRKRDFENRDLGLVHRDVSPQNVLISFAGDVKLCDFGIAKAATKASQTRAGALKGKLQYMSPEQAWGKDIDHRSDIFSLGLVLYEMLTSEKVFAGDSELSVLEQVRDPIIPAPSTKNPDIDAEIDRIVFLALNADREERYQSAQDFQRDLEKVLRDHDWSPDRESVAGLLVQLGDDGGSGTTPVAPPVDTAVVPPPQEPPSPPPPEIPITPPPMEDGRDPLFVVDDELERALGSSSEPDTAVAVLDIEDSGTGRSGTADGVGNKRLGILLGVLMLAAVVVVGGWLIYRGKGPEAPPTSRSIAVLPTATPTPESTAGLLSEEELIAQARDVAAAEILKQEEELRKRLEEEFPTPTSTPVPPTPTPTETETPEPTLTPTLPPTATPVPPTATPIPPTPTPSVREGDIVTPGPGVIVPTVIFQEQPQYPVKARSMQVDGLVDAEALVGINGVVEDVRIVNVSRKKVGFEEATENAVMKWRYKPATKKGVKVRMWVPIRVPFRLR